MNVKSHIEQQIESTKAQLKNNSDLLENAKQEEKLYKKMYKRTAYRKPLMIANGGILIGSGLLFVGWRFAEMTGYFNNPISWVGAFGLVFSPVYGVLGSVKVLRPMEYIRKYVNKFQNESGALNQRLSILEPVYVPNVYELREGDEDIFFGIAIDASNLEVRLENAYQKWNSFVGKKFKFPYSDYFQAAIDRVHYQALEKALEVRLKIFQAMGERMRLSQGYDSEDLTIQQCARIIHRFPPS